MTIKKQFMNIICIPSIEYKKNNNTKRWIPCAMF